MVIHPEVVVTPDCPTVKIREPMEKVDLEAELRKILHAQGWGVGTYFHVQFISHDRSTLMQSAPFVVTEVKESVHTSEANPYQPVTKTVYGRGFSQIGAWTFFGEQVIPEPKPEPKPERDDSPKIVWNPGKKVHQVKMGNQVLFESADKTEAIDYMG